MSSREAKIFEKSLEQWVSKDGQISLNESDLFGSVDSAIINNNMDFSEYERADLYKLAFHTFLLQKLENIYEEVESLPLEDSQPSVILLCLALIIVARDQYGAVVIKNNGDTFGDHEEELTGVIEIEVDTKIGDLPIDILITYKRAGHNFIRDKNNKLHKVLEPKFEKKVIINIDERTIGDTAPIKQQSPHNRTLQTIGYLVFNYLEVDIYEDAFECADKIIQAISDDEDKNRTYQKELS